MRPTIAFLAALVVTALVSACGGNAAPPAAPAGSTGQSSILAQGQTKPSAPASASGSTANGSAAASGSPAAGGATGGVTQAKLDFMYAAARKEGEVIFGGQSTPDDYRGVGAAFEKRFPGIKVTIVPTDTSTIGQRLVTESSAGRVSLDTAISAVTSISPALNRDLLVTHDFQGDGVDPSEIGVDGKFLWTQDVVVGWVYNTRLVSEADVPKTWQDLLDPNWKGKMNIAKSAAGFDMLRLTMNEPQIHAYLQQLAKQNPVPVNGAAEGLNRVATGQDYFTNATSFDTARRSADQGAPVGAMPLPQIYSSPQGLFTVKGIPHPNAAELFILWLTTPEAKAAMAQAGFGRFQPCGPLPIDKYVCGKNYDIFYIDTVQKGNDGARMRPLFANDLGFSS